MEKALNTVLYVLFGLFAVAFLASRYEASYTPKPFVQPETHAPPLFKIGEKVPVGDDPWFSTWLAAPLPPNGAAPEGWSAEEAALDAASCGTCHAEAHARWSESAHARAMGPRVLAAAATLSAPEQAACMACHAPMTEQRPRLPDGADNPDHVEALAAEGVGCAACHVRAHARLGPSPEPAEGAPHGGHVPTPQLAESRACAACHEGGPSPHDKRAWETFSEWRRTRFAAEGLTCQGCHAADGGHDWAGLDDEDFARRAFQATASVGTPGGWLEPTRATLTLTNTGAGHRLPTTATPALRLTVQQLDASGAPLPDTLQEGLIARQLSEDGQTERFDTRLLPDESFELAYSARRHEQAAQLLARVEVLPDAAWAARLDAEPRRYVAWERALPLDPAP